MATRLVPGMSGLLYHDRLGIASLPLQKVQSQHGVSVVSFKDLTLNKNINNH